MHDERFVVVRSGRRQMQSCARHDNYFDTSIDTMTLRKVQRYRRDIRRSEEMKELTAGIEPLIDPDFITLEPGTEEANDLLAVWRPALYGYGGLFAEKVHGATLDLRDGPFGLVECRYVGERVEVVGVVNDLAAAPGLPAHLEIKDKIVMMAAAGAGKTIETPDWVAAQDLQVPYAHLDQLLSLFYALDREFAVLGNDHYSSHSEFLLDGFGTATSVLAKNSDGCARIVSVRSDPAIVAEMSRVSRMPGRLASLSQYQMFAAEAGLSVGVFSEDSSSTRNAEWDLAALGTDGDVAGVPVLDSAVILEDLYVPRSCEQDRTGNYDLTGDDLLRVRGLRDMTYDGRRRDRIGCLALVEGEDETSTFTELRKWQAEVTAATRTPERQLQHRREHQSRYPKLLVPESVRKRNMSLAARMIEEGHLTRSMSSPVKELVVESSRRRVKPQQRKGTVPDLDPYANSGRRHEATPREAAPILGRVEREIAGPDVGVSAVDSGLGDGTDLDPGRRPDRLSSPGSGVDRGIEFG